MSTTVATYESSRPLSLDRRRFGLLWRLLVLALLFTAELLLLSVWLDNSALTSRGGIAGFVGHWGAWTVKGIVGFAVIFVTFAYLKNGAALAGISKQVEQASVGRGLLAAHLSAMAAFGALSWALYGNHLTASFARFSTPLWLVAGGSGLAFGAFSLIPPALWLELVRATGSLWAFASGAVIFACVAGSYIRSLWAPTARLTFGLVKALLSLFVSGIIADPATMTLGTAKFSVEIAPECSGFEGAGLILSFGCIWLWLLRRECRFPQALILLPAGVATIFGLNAVRIAALILIGDAGARQIALGGFHSQAGWIAFNIVALGLSVAATRSPWLIAPASRARAIDSGSSDNPTVTYLLPFVIILAAGMVSAAASARFRMALPDPILSGRRSPLDLPHEIWESRLDFGWFGPRWASRLRPVDRHRFSGKRGRQ